MLMVKDMDFEKGGMKRAEIGLGGHAWNRVDDRQWLMEVKNTVMRDEMEKWSSYQ